MRVLVTGCGGMGGVSFVRALRLGEKLAHSLLFIVGTEFNPYYIHFPEVDVRVRSPRHTSPEFMASLLNLVEKHDIYFVHPNPSSEAKVVAEHLRSLKRENGSTDVKTFLPSASAIAPDKETVWNKLREHSVPVPNTKSVSKLGDIDDAFETFGFPLWIRAKQGAGGRLSLKVNTPEEAKTWVNLNTLQGRASPYDFILQEFLEGRDLAFDSLWYKGKLVTSSTRERLEYPFKHISLTGITGTPSAAKTIRNENADNAGVKAVKALDPIPHGFYSVDLKENSEGKPVVTEVDGKWHTTAPLWGYAFAKVKEDNSFNIAYTYLLMGLGSKVPALPERNLYPEQYILIRQMDSGVLLLDDRKKKLHRVL